METDDFIQFRRLPCSESFSDALFVVLVGKRGFFFFLLLCSATKFLRSFILPAVARGKSITKAACINKRKTLVK